MEPLHPELSSEERYVFDSQASVRSHGRRWQRLAEDALVGNTSARWLGIATGVSALVAMWLLLSPPHLLSRSLTWDLLFNLSGAWHLHTGQVPHVDYHDPLGILYYGLTQLGFRVFGPVPRAFLVGQAIFGVFVFVTALVAASRRLPPLAAAVFVLYAVLQVLLPTNIGDLVNAYSFAMAYNRWGWSVLMTLALILFLPRRTGRPAPFDHAQGSPERSRGAPISDAVLCGVLLLVAFYLKITFAVAGLMAVGLALIASDSVRAAWRTWIAMLIAVFACAAAPYNSAYWSDILHGLTAGYARVSLQIQFTRSLDNKAEYALYGAGILVMIWLWRQGRASLQRVALAVGTLAIGVIVLSQNAQDGQIGLGIVIACLIYVALCDESRDRPLARTGIGIALLAVMVWPLLGVASMAMTLAGYNRAAQRESAIFTSDTTNLRTLAVPYDSTEVAEALATIDLPYAPLGPTHEPPLDHQITQFEYVQTLLEAASLYATGERGRPKLWVADQVNPLPFVLGFPPPRGERLWTRYALRPLPADEIFRDVDVILIPKYPTYAQVTTFALTTYYDYISKHFPLHEQTPSWTILSRQASSTDDGTTGINQR